VSQEEHTTPKRKLFMLRDFRPASLVPSVGASKKPYQPEAPAREASIGAAPRTSARLRFGLVSSMVCDASPQQQGNIRIRASG
jgi:hypothetical protein